MELEHDWKARCAVLAAANARHEKRCHAYRALLLQVHAQLLATMINEQHDAKNTALYEQIKHLESALAAIDTKPARLKSKL